MADVLPINFPVPSESAIASYPYNDIIDGTGHVLFYLYRTEDTSGYEYRMSTQQIRSSSPPFKDTTTATTTLTFYSDPFNAPKNLKGVIKWTFCNSEYKSANDGTGTLTWEIKVYHYDGTTSTQIGSTWTSQAQSQENAGWNAETFSGYTTVSSNVHFKIGHQIKMEVKYTKTGAVGFDVAELGLSPFNRDSTNANGLQPSSDTDSTSQFLVWVPFRLVD